MNTFLLIAASMVYFPLTTPPYVMYESTDIENIAEYSTNAGCESARPAVDAIITDIDRKLKATSTSKCVQVQKANPGDPSYTLVIKASTNPNGKSARTSDTTTISRIANNASCISAGNDVETLAAAFSGMTYPSVRIETTCIPVQ